MGVSYHNEHPKSTEQQLEIMIHRDLGNGDDHSVPRSERAGKPMQVLFDRHNR